MRVKDCMCEDIIWATPDTKIKDVAKLMQTNDIGSVPICNSDKKIIGFVTDRDIIVRGIANNVNVDNANVEEIMTKEVIKTTPDTDALSAARIMSYNKIRRLPVIKDNEVIGMLTIGDLAKTNDIPYGRIGITLENICFDSNE